MSDFDFLQDNAPPPPAPAKKGLTLGTWMVILGVLAVTTVLGIQLSRQLQIQPQAGELAPNFTLTTFEGETFTLEDLRGQIVLVNFWGSWCLPCRAEAPELQALHETYEASGLRIVGVNWLDSEREARAFVQEFGLTYPNGPDVREVIAKQYRITGAPENFVIGRDGRVVETIIGVASYRNISRIIERILATEATQ